MKKKIKSVSLGSDIIHIYESRTATHQKCAEVYFAGPQGWGITMSIPLESVDDFTRSTEHQSRFIEVAKDKLGTAA